MESLPAYRRSRTGRISERLYAVSTPVVSFYLYTDGKSTVCVDAGMSPRMVRSGLARVGIDPASVSHVFLTHSDADHVGGVAAFPNATILLPRAEEPVARGLRPRRILFLERRNHFLAPSTPIDDGETVHVGAITIRAIATPGHTAGSTSYLVGDEVLLTGDLITLRKGRARPSPRLITEDVEQDARSIARLVSLVPNAAFLCTAHSGYTADYAGAMEAWR